MAPKRKLHGKSGGKGSRGAPGKAKVAAKDAKSKCARTAEPAEPVKLYTATDLILVLGDGDFTFSKGLVKHRGTGDGLLATSFDSDATVRSKYSNAHQCINDIRSLKGRVLHDVDATKLDELPLKLKDGTYVPSFFKYILFNFPHSGQQRVHVNRALLRDFFESARSRLFKNGEVHVTLKTKPPYSNWLIEEQAKAADLVLKERRKFNIRLFPGYNHRTTDPQAKAFEPDLCVTYVFIVNRSKHPFEAIAQAQRLKQQGAAFAAGAVPPVMTAKEASNTVIAQLLQAHARAKAAQANERVTAPVATKTTAISNSSIRTPEADIKVPSSSAEHETRGGPVVASVAVVQRKQKTSQQELKSRRSQTLWTPLHRRPAQRLTSVIAPTKQ